MSIEEVRKIIVIYVTAYFLNFSFQEEGLVEDPTSLEIEVIVKAVEKIEQRVQEIDSEIDGIEKVYKYKRISDFSIV